MLAKRIIPCLDVKDGKVVKGVNFRNHRVMGDILEYAEYYSCAGADELVFYDITASSDNRIVDKNWVTDVARKIDIPASGGAGKMNHFQRLFNEVDVDGALAATVFHSGLIQIGVLKQYLQASNIEVRV